MDIARAYISEEDEDSYFLPNGCYFVGDPNNAPLNEEGKRLYQKSEMHRMWKNSMHFTFHSTTYFFD
jgi:hypothetical protein